MRSLMGTLKTAAATLALVSMLTACDPNQQQANQQQQPGPFGPQQPGANANNNGWPAMPGMPTQPGQPGQPGQNGWPQGPQQPGMPNQPGYPQQPGYPNQPGAYPQQPGYPGGGGGQPMQASVPSGMYPVQSQAGAVFASNMNGTRSAQRLSQTVLQSLEGYFDSPLQVMGQMNDPSDMFSQVGFQTTLRGRPVMGIIAAMSNGQNGGRGYLMFDSADRFNQTAPIMMNVVQQNAGQTGGIQGGGGQQNPY